MLEKTIEQELVNQVKKRGGICPKWVSPSFAGVPDRLVFLPDGKFGMVEVKRPKGKPRALQVSRHEQLKRLGFTVYVLDGLEQIGGMLDAIEST